MINTVALTGRLTREPELKQTGSGIPVISFNLAVNRTFKNANGEREADFIMCQAWRKTAELVADHLSKGSLIGVEGRIQTRNYQDNDNKTVYITEVVVDNLTFLETKAESQNNNQSNNSYQSNTGQSNSNVGQNTSNKGQQNSFQGQNTDDPFESNDDVADISDDDLPF